MRRHAAVAVAILCGAFTADRATANDGVVSTFVRGDSDSTVVVSPRAAARVRIDETTVDAAYSADVWTSASIDVRTAATVPITEQRDQLDLSATHELEDVTFGGSYYFSGENDYWSHGLTLRSMQELGSGSTTLEESIRYVHDIVGRSGDSSFSRPLDTVGGRFVLTQVLSPEAIIQAVWEGAFRIGYQSSPYRYVGLGGDGLCNGTAILCIPEAHPETRVRNALVVQGRYAISRDASVGLGYRFYFDDWGVLAHTGIAQVAWVPTRGSILTLRYRFYSQSAAAFCMGRYPLPDAQINFVTRDRELSAMFGNRIALSYEGRASITEHIALRAAIALGGTVFVYQDFPGLTEVYAGDATVALTLEL
ncbi:MAG: DUF3570 domain-containing protein [Sandaracinaceae bacterium]|nr:DUF3570 domain-containing protein [Sandaracinaceae bacterium]